MFPETHLKYILYPLAIIAVSALSWATLVVQAQPAKDDLTLIVSRDEGYVEFYIQGSADLVLELLGKRPEEITDKNDAVDFASFQNGTWKTADRLIDQLKVHLDGNGDVLEAMSLMLHPKSDLIPFQTPTDGQFAVSICNALSREPVSDLSTLNLFAGYILVPASKSSAIQISFPNANLDKTFLRLITYTQGQFLSSKRLRLNNHATINIPT